MHRAPGPRVCGLSPRGGAREARAPGQARPSPFALHRGPRHQLLTGRTPGLKEAPSLLTWQTGVTQRDTEGLRCPLTRPGGLPLPPPALTPAAAEGRKVPHTHLARGSAVRRSCTGSGARRPFGWARTLQSRGPWSPGRRPAPALLGSGLHGQRRQVSKAPSVRAARPQRQPHHLGSAPDPQALDSREPWPLVPHRLGDCCSRGTSPLRK